MPSSVTTIDAHTAGEPFRIVTSGVPVIPGATMPEKRRWAEANLDGLRRLLMWEPRGHADMYGCVLTEPVSPNAVLGVLFMHNDGFSTMCGHGIIALATVAVEAGLVRPTDPDTSIGIDTPAGLVHAVVTRTGGRIRGARFRNVPAFVSASNQSVSVPDLGVIRYDVAFGGAFYAFVDADQAGMTLEPGAVGDLIRAGMAIKRAVAERGGFEHPYERSLSFLYGTIFTGPAHGDAHHSRHVCVFANGEVDRSPTGTGVSARAALLAARGELAPGDWISIESVLGTTFGVRVVGSTDFGPYPAVIPEVSGQAYITGRHEFVLDPDDTVGTGFLLR